MQIKIESDASINTEEGAQSRAGASFYLGDRHLEEGRRRRRNGLIEARSDIIRTVVLSATEGEYIALFMASLRALYLKQIAEAMGFIQGPIVIRTDNEAAMGILNSTYGLKRTRSINVRFHWLRQQVSEGAFIILWIQGIANIADFFTKPLGREKFEHDRPEIIRISKSPVC